MLNTFKAKLNTQGNTTSLSSAFLFSNVLDGSSAPSTTPPGSPPSDLHSRSGLSNTQNPTVSTAPAGSAASDTSAILAALANMARQNTVAPPATTQYPTKDNSYLQNVQKTPNHQASALNHTFTPPFPSSVTAPVAPPVSNPNAANTFAPQPNPANNSVPSFSNLTNTYAAAPPAPPIPPAVPSTPGLDPSVQQQLILIKALSDQGFSPDKIAGIIAAVGNRTTIPSSQHLTAQNQIPPIGQGLQNSWEKLDESRDRDAYEPSRSPSQRFRRRSRSRSPQGWNTRDSPMRRREEIGFDFERGSPRVRVDDRNRGRGRVVDYRQRSPPRRAHSPSPPQNMNNSNNKWIGYDNTIPKGSIKGTEWYTNKIYFYTDLS